MPGVKDWITKATSNLKAAKKLIKDDDTLDLAAYSTQQSVPRTHDLEKLLKDCMAYDSSFAVLRDAAEALSPYATYTRYPDNRFNIDRKETDLAIKYAEKVLTFVQHKINHSKYNLQQNLFEP